MFFIISFNVNDNNTAPCTFLIENKMNHIIVNKFTPRTITRPITITIKI